MAKEAKGEREREAGKTGEGSFSDVEGTASGEDVETSASESESEEDEELARLAAAGKPAAGKAAAGKKQRKTELTPVGKLRFMLCALRKLRGIIWKFSPPQYRHLVLIRSMKIRWNTTCAELERAGYLALAFNEFVAKMAHGLNGQARRVAEARQKRWMMQSHDWVHLAECLTEEHNLAGALLAGAWMAKKYINKALVGDFALLGAVLHPAIRISYFQQSGWDITLAVRARILSTDVVAKHARARAAAAATNSDEAVMEVY
ncbi:hypothetical protein B0H13DRAFT_2329481 [Mycena leptocephala]|nr:hypothetical protein B0H13DRAFT_2329481 [Mycena leptocephala]